jgi:hypothetical protein
MEGPGSGRGSSRSHGNEEDPIAVKYEYKSGEFILPDFTTDHTKSMKSVGFYQHQLGYVSNCIVPMM